MKDKSGLTCFIIIAAVYAALAALGIGCPIKFFTGISCAGCGMTRAWISALRLDFCGAFMYHPLFPAPAVFCVIYLIRGKISSEVFRIICGVSAALFIIVYAVRMFMPSDMVVGADIRGGALYKSIRYILGGMKKW